MGCLTVEVLNRTPNTIDISSASNVGNVVFTPIELSLNVDIADKTAKTIDVSCNNTSDITLDITILNKKPTVSTKSLNTSLKIEIGLVCEVSLGAYKVFFVTEGPFIVDNGYFIVNNTRKHLI